MTFISLHWQTYKLSHRTVIAATFGYFIAVASTSRISVTLDRIKIMGRVAFARYNSRVGKFVNNYVSGLRLYILLRINWRVEHLKMIVITPSD